MAKDDDKVRLPELPIFKKYSLALRQEFAPPKEFLTVLDRTATKVQTLLDRAEAKRRRELESQQMEAASLPELSSVEEVVEEEPLQESAPAEFPFDAPPTESPGLEKGIDTHSLPENGTSLGVGPPSRASEGDVPPIWEPEADPASRSPLTRGKKTSSTARNKKVVPRTRKSPRKVTRRKTAIVARKRTPRPEIIRVSSRGTPLRRPKSRPSPARKKK